MIYFRRNPLRIYKRKINADCIPITTLPVVNNLKLMTGMLLLIDYIDPSVRRVTYITKIHTIYTCGMETWETCLRHERHTDVSKMCLGHMFYQYNSNMTMTEIFSCGIASLRNVNVYLLNESQEEL